jgi:hypothetical protein
MRSTWASAGSPLLTNKLDYLIIQSQAGQEDYQGSPGVQRRSGTTAEALHGQVVRTLAAPRLPI